MTHSDILYQDPIATYNPVPLSNLTQSLPQVDFPTYFSTFTPRSFPDKVILTYPAYAESLSKILEDTPSDVIEAYLIIRASLSLSPYLSMNTEAWQAQRTLLETLSGIKKGAVGDRAEYCVGQIEETMGFAAGRYFVNQTFGGDSREKGTKVITGEHSLFVILNGYTEFPMKILSRPLKPPYPTSIGWTRSLGTQRQRRSIV